ncbi:Carbamoyltransferase HypF [Dissostichus eleginoides]|uniref:Carbamoyltransferase HypF n=1 Tax=Dissostichus eleginoides TaxID=100907 RepID=A0AAD9CFK5_DISEL|nr:Carbamoyltransferase HypF [Dissostichus eleginoides]
MGNTRAPTPGRSRPLRVEDFDLPPSPPSPPLHLFTRHEHGGNKTANWSLTPSREILIVGASNISRLPLIRDIRAVSHGTHSPGGQPTSPGVHKVILSFGLNDRGRGNTTLLESKHQKLLQSAKDTFPNAAIFIPIINISSNLTLKPTQNIRILNQLIFQTFHSLPKLRQSAFSMDQDNIHWSPNTARLMWDHWRSFLVFGNPTLTHHP